MTTVTGVVYVLGTAVSTFIAHLVGECVGDSIREDKDPSWIGVRAQMRNSAPVASSASIPAVLLAAA